MWLQAVPRSPWGPAVNTSRSGPTSPAGPDHVDRTRSPESTAEAHSIGTAIGAFDDLRARLRAVIGPLGWNALFGRALKRASARHSVLNSVDADIGTADALLDAVRAHAGARPAAEAEAALRDIMSEILTLLNRMIGEDLVQSVLHANTTGRRTTREEAEGGRDG